MLNVGLVLATVATLLVGGDALAALAVLARSAGASDTARSVTAPTVTSAVDARLAIFQARSGEGVALLGSARAGSTADLETRWVRDVAVATSALSPRTGHPVRRRARRPRHLPGRARDGAPRPGRRPALTRQVEVLDRQHADAGTLLRTSGWLCLAAGVGVAVLGWRGLGRRPAEYR